MGPAEGRPPAVPATVPRWRRPGIAALLIGYFLLLDWHALAAPFAADEMLAIWTYWRPSPWRLLTSQFLLWRGYFRPMGGLFYLPVYQLFGLNPRPYHVVLLVLLLAGAHAMYRFARTLGVGERVSALVALVACYHLGLNNLYYNSVFVFDVLCGLFYFTTFAWYARIRSTGRLLTGRHTAILLLLYLCALNSKEMALTMPAVLLAYEWLFHESPPLRGFFGRPFWRWLAGPGRPLCWVSLMALVSIWGKRFGQYGLMNSPAYRPVFSWERLADFQQRYLGDIFLSLPNVSGTTAIVLWLVVTWLAWRRPRPVLRFCWWYILLTPLPIQFLIGRDQACLYVPLAGWAVFAAVLFADLVEAAPRLLADDLFFRRLSPRAISAVVLALGVLSWAAVSWRFAVSVAPGMAALGPRTQEVLDAFRAANPRVPPHSYVVFLDDPFRTWDTAFIADLWFKDRSVTVRLNQQTPLSPDELARADRVYTFEAGKLVQLR